MKTHIYLSSMYALLLICSSVVGGQAYDREYTQIECSITPIVRKDINRSHPNIPGPRSSRLPTDTASSTNWAGYVAATHISNPVDHSVTSVSGTWIVPMKIVPTPDDSYMATWVGIDGFTSPSVEQIGTSHNWANGARQDYTWFEMYPQGAFLINGFPLNPGDVISASVVYVGNSVFALTISNNTHHVSFTVPTSYTTSTTASRSSAEWIVEAPYSSGILSLADFAVEYLWGCMATINGFSAPISNHWWQNSVIQMITSNGAPKAVTSPLLPDNGSFFVTWTHE